MSRSRYGRPLDSKIDTGGDLFTLNAAAADALGIGRCEFTVTFSGGAPW